VSLFTGVAFVFGLVYLVCLVIVWTQRPARPHTLGILSLFLILSAVWSLAQAFTRLGWPVSVSQAIIERLSVYGVLILAIIFLQLTRSFLSWRQAPGTNWVGLAWLVGGIAWLTGLLLLDANSLALSEMIQVVPVTPVALQTVVLALLIAGWAMFTGGATLYTVRLLKKYARYQTAISYWVLALLILVVGDGFIFAHNLQMGMILRLLGVLLAVFSISTARLASLSHLLRTSTSFVVYSASAIVLYTLGLIVVQIVLRNRPYSPAYGGLVMALVLVIFFNPVLSLIRASVERWFLGERQDPAHLLRQYSQSITNILDLQLLATVAVGTASEFLEVQRGYLFLVDYEQGAENHNEYLLRGVTGMGDTNPAPGKIAQDCPLVTFFQDELRPLTQEEIDTRTQFRKMTHEERAWLDSLGADVFAPIFSKNEWIGMMALGPKASGSAYSTQDLMLLSTIADQTAIALENTRLVEGLVRLNNDFRRAYSALDQANRRLERLDRTKTDFISIASHELRTPLTLISGSSQMLLEDPALQANPYYQQMLSKMYSGTLRLHEIVDSMLDMAKIDTRGLELETRSVLVGELINTVYQQLQKSASDRKQTIKIFNLDSLPPLVADPEAMRKVFYHLLINAIKYTPDGGEITIKGRELSANPVDLPSGGVEIVIMDTGIGIDPQYQELIFAKFYQTGELALHSSGKTKFKGGGPGLGLAIARGIVQAHHGKIWVESLGYDEATCPGSVFYVVLPLRPMEEKAVDQRKLFSQFDLPPGISDSGGQSYSDF
jgi:signal transduction histidine kinase